MEAERAEAIVLRRQPVTESSLIVTWFTRQFGKLKTVVQMVAIPFLLFDGALFGVIKSALDAKNKKKANNGHDALIAEVAIKNHYVLITSDCDLSAVTRANGCQVVQITKQP